MGSDGTPNTSSGENTTAEASRRPVGYIVPYHSGESSDSSLLDVVHVFWQSRWIMILAPFLLAVLTAGYSLTIPDVYRGDVLLAPVKMDDTSSNLVSNLGGLASLTGLSINTSGDTEENLAILQSREFLWRFIEDQQLLQVLFSEEWDSTNNTWRQEGSENQPTLWDAYRKFDTELLKVTSDPKTGLVRVSIDWTDPVLASAWANELVRRLNEHLRGRAIERSEKNLEFLNNELARSTVAEMLATLYGLIAKEQRTVMLANTQVDFAFRIVDPSVIPDQKVRPKRTAMVLLAGVIGGILAMFYVLLAHALRANSA